MPRLKFDISTLPAAPTLEFEQGLWERGVRFIAGIDEAGRGALAGPVAAAAVILPADPGLPAVLDGVRDSKQMQPQARQERAGRIREVALAWGVGLASNLEIDALGIVPATRLAIHRALAELAVQPEHLLVDYLPLPDEPLPQTSLVKGDARSLSIAAASVLAKTARDDLLRLLDRDYPEYGFAAHKGYGTLSHRRRLGQIGPCPIHRKTFTFATVEID